MASSSDAGSEEEMTLGLKWAGKDFIVRVCADDTVGELKRRICELTNVLPKRQKLLNLKVGVKPAPDSSLLSSVTLKPGVKISMMGTVEDEIFVDPVDSPEILDDFELGEEDSVDIKDADVNKAKLRRRVDNFKLTFLNPPRPGKKLLVLDIDYTLFDHRSTAENPKELMRPWILRDGYLNDSHSDLHEFLSASYSAYDIIIWSATSMKWVEVKMKELGVLNNPSYQITALMDHLAMITVQSPTHGVFDCKPLGVIWAKCPEFYSPSNTIMFDDLKRNFVMNPQNGLVIKPFRKAHLNRATDNELVGLTEYLLAIADRESLSGLDHRKWRDYAGHQQWER